MWFTEDGRSHSVGLPNPDAHLAESARLKLASRPLDELRAAVDAPRVRELMDTMLDDVEAWFAREYADGFRQDAEDEFIDVPLPWQIAFPYEGDDLADSLAAWCDSLPIRWRIDAYHAATEAIWNRLDARRSDEEDDRPLLLPSAADAMVREYVRWSRLMREDPSRAVAKSLHSGEDGADVWHAHLHVLLDGGPAARQLIELTIEAVRDDDAMLADFGEGFLSTWFGIYFLSQAEVQWLTDRARLDPAFRTAVFYASHGVDDRDPAVRRLKELVAR